MRRRRGFFLNISVIVLLIPLLLLLATYEDVSSQIIHSQSARFQLERTSNLVSFLTMDFQKALQLSGKRALVTVVDYVSVTGNFISPTYMANNTIRDLVLTGSTPQIPSTYTGILNVMANQTIYRWLVNVNQLLREQGYTMSPNTTELLNEIKSQMMVAPLDSFQMVIRAKIPNVTVRDMSGKVVYTGSIPKSGYIFSIININQIEDPIFSAMTGGRYHRSIRACQIAYPEMTPPFRVVNGSGKSSYDHVIGVYGADLYFNASKIWDLSGDYITNVTENGVRVNPGDVLSNSDRGVLVFKNVTTSTSGWCVYSKYKVNMTLPSTTQLNTIVLLKIPTASAPFGTVTHDGNLAAITIYKAGTCISAPYWIEYWGQNYILIWLNTTNTTRYTVYYGGLPLSAGNIGIFKYHLTDFNLTAGLRKSQGLFDNLTWKSFMIRYDMNASSSTEDFDGGVGINFEAPQPATCLATFVNYSWTFYDWYLFKWWARRAVKRIISGAAGIPTEIYNIQIPIRLSAQNISALGANWTINKAAIAIKDANGTPLPFWIQYWNASGALIWVKMNLTINATIQTVSSWIFTIYNVYYYYENTITICPDGGTPTQGNGSRVFIFFDNFENNATWSEWIKYGLGLVKPTTLVAHDGIYSLEKYGYNDPNGAYRDIGITVNRTTGLVLEYWDYRLDTLGGPLDRVGLINSIGDGYGAVLYPSRDEFGIDVRTNYRGSIYWSPTGITLGIHRWHFVRFTILSDEVSIQVYDSNMNFLGGYNITNTLYSDFTRVYVFGGHDYAVDTIRLRKYVNLSKLVEVTYKTQSYVTLPANIEFIDDNPGFTDHGGDKLAILSNWTVNLANYPGTWYVTQPHRYQAVVQKGTSNLSLEFYINPDTPSVISDSAVYNASVVSPINVSAVIDNSVGNDAHFAWLFVYKYPYSEPPQTFSTPVLDPYYGTAGASNAKAYDIQVLVNCLQDQRYFGIRGGWSFFERLEGSDVNHAKYVAIADEMQKALGTPNYPIGLVSFMIPSVRYDASLVNLLLILGISQTDIVNSEESSTDYYFLQYIRYGTVTRGYRVWGISEGNSVVLGDLTQVPFFIDNRTAYELFGPSAYEDLVYRG